MSANAKGCAPGCGIAVLIASGGDSAQESWRLSQAPAQRKGQTIFVAADKLKDAIDRTIVQEE